MTLLLKEPEWGHLCMLSPLMSHTLSVSVTVAATTRLDQQWVAETRPWAWVAALGKAVRGARGSEV